MRGSSDWSGKGLLLILCLLACTTQAATGPEVAQLLNNRYRATPQECPGNHPAYYCSGVLVSGLAGNFTVKFWEHGPTAIALGARGFSYLRRDVGTRTLTQPSGMVFTDSFTAISQGKPLDVLCAFPLVAANRDKYGCGVGGNESDPGSCAAQGVSDAPGWLAHFQQQGQAPSLQCSLSSRIAAQFRASLLAHEQLGGSWSAQPNELQVRNWDPQAPGQVPVQALFYDLKQRGGLRVAQADQNDYYAATGQWLPILRLDLTQADGLVFGFDLQEQLYVGYQVAERLNKRYFNTAKTCPNGQPAPYCNGVIVRGVHSTSQFHSWNPSPIAIAMGGVSSSYARADSSLVMVPYRQGLLFKPLSAPAINPVPVRCYYPFDGWTQGGGDACTKRQRCSDLGIDSVEKWAARYTSNVFDSCSFSPTEEGVQLMMDIRNGVTHPHSHWNESVLTLWEQNIPEQLPVDALYHSDGGVPGDGPVGARYIQDDYFKVTGRFWPIVHMRFDATDGQVFSFTPNDQCLRDTCPPPPDALGVQETDFWLRFYEQ
ncbi:hypothetical protein J3P80_18185 [Pseudomonas sp. D2-30]|uniref:hypothetical protein n=1 Tax=unclassified Pseudomonas TaxID=196821 RepID=UPI003DA81144